MPDVLPGCALMASKGEQRAFLAGAAKLLHEVGAGS